MCCFETNEFKFWKICIYYTLSCLQCFFTDKTLNLLKQGTRSLSKVLNNSQEFETFEISSNKPSFVCETKSKNNSKQMVLNNQLQLEKTDKIIKVCSNHNDLKIILDYSDNFFLN